MRLDILRKRVRWGEDSQRNALEDEARERRHAFEPGTGKTQKALEEPELTATEMDTTARCEVPVCGNISVKGCVREGPSQECGHTVPLSEVPGLAPIWAGMSRAKIPLLGKKITSLSPGNSPNIIHLEFSEAKLTNQCQNQNERKLSKETPSHPLLSQVKNSPLCFLCL